MKYLCFLLLAFGSLRGEAFIQKKGKSFFAPEYWTYRTAHFWNRKGVRENSGEVFNKKEINLYYEYGLTDKDTLVAKALYDWIDQSKQGKTIGFEDFEVAWKRALCQKKACIYSTQLWLIIPSGPANKPALRYGRFGIQGDIMYGQSFKFKKDQNGFFDAGLGYRWYSGYPSDQIRGYMNLGFDLTEKFQLILSTYLEWGVYNGQAQMVEEVIVNDPNYRLLKGYLTFRYRLSKIVSLVAGPYAH